MRGRIRGILWALLTALGLLAQPALAQANTSNASLPVPEVKPSAPAPIVSLAGRILSFLLFIAMFAGLAAVAVGAVKFVAGGEDAGRWIGRGIIALAIAAGFWAIIKFFI